MSKFEPYQTDARNDSFGRSLQRLIVVALFLGLFIVVGQAEKQGWWLRLPVFWQRTIEGSFIGGSGIAFLWDRSRDGTWIPTAPWDLKFFLMDLAMVIAGLVELVAGFRAR